VSLRAAAVLFDLDNTLVPELPNYGAAFAAACGDLAREHRRLLRPPRDRLADEPAQRLPW